MIATARDVCRIFRFSKFGSLIRKYFRKTNLLGIRSCVLKIWV